MFAYCSASYLFSVVGSKYKFRVLAVNTSGVSEPSEHTEEIMIGNSMDQISIKTPNP
jgi:hypothetical protein